MKLPKLNYPAIHLRARRTTDGRTEIFDQVRGRWLLLTPEEWVRRHVVDYMLSECGFEPQQIVEEHPVNISGMAQRADIVAMDSNGKPLVVVECKEPNVKIEQNVLDQVVRYNSVLKCRYIVLTNGFDSFCYSMDDNGIYSPINYFPHHNM